MKVQDPGVTFDGVPVPNGGSRGCHIHEPWMGRQKPLLELLDDVPIELPRHQSGWGRVDLSPLGLQPPPEKMVGVGLGGLTTF